MGKTEAPSCRAVAGLDGIGGGRGHRGEEKESENRRVSGAETLHLFPLPHPHCLPFSLLSPVSMAFF